MKQEDSRKKPKLKECEVCGSIVSDHPTKHANTAKHKKFEKMSPEKREVAKALRKENELESTKNNMTNAKRQVKE